MRTPDEWQKVFAGLPRRKTLDRRRAAQRVAKLDKLSELEGRFKPCMNCDGPTSTAPGGAGRSTTILASGQIMVLCMRCKRLDRRARVRKRIRKSTAEKRVGR